MKYSCTHCGLMTEHSNLWCQRHECDFRNLNHVLQAGDYFGDFKIKNLVRVLRSSAIYEAERDEEMVFLKIAHFDKQEDLYSQTGYGAYLKREAKTLDQFARHTNLTLLPKILSPTLRGKNQDMPYGKLVYRDQPRYYMVFAHMQGIFLRDYLNENPQPPDYIAGWIVYDLAETIIALHQVMKHGHWALSPDVVFLHKDEDDLLRPILMDFGFYGHQPDPTMEERYQSEADKRHPDRWYQFWVNRYTYPAYTAPELLILREDLKAGRATDVYGLGLILYELLAGHPRHEFRNRPTELIIQEILDERQITALDRQFDLSKDLIDLVRRAINFYPTTRITDMTEFAKELKRIFGKPEPKIPKTPRKRLGRWINRNYQQALVWVLVAGLGLLVLIGVIENL